MKEHGVVVLDIGALSSLQYFQELYTDGVHVGSVDQSWYMSSAFLILNKYLERVARGSQNSLHIESLTDERCLTTEKVLSVFALFSVGALATTFIVVCILSHRRNKKNRKASR
jgi:hypothetical protein